MRRRRARYPGRVDLIPQILPLNFSLAADGGECRKINTSQAGNAAPHQNARLGKILPMLKVCLRFVAASH